MRLGVSPSVAADIEHAAGPDLAFRIALDAARDRKAVIRIGASTASLLRGNGNLIDALQHQWPFMTELQRIQIWAGDDNERANMTGSVRSLSSAIIPAVIPTIIAHTIFHAGLGAEVATCVLSIVAIILGSRWWFLRRAAQMTESTAIDIIHARLVDDAAKYPQRVPFALKMFRYDFAKLP